MRKSAATSKDIRGRWKRETHSKLSRVHFTFDPQPALINKRHHPTFLDRSPLVVRLEVRPGTTVEGH
jgi:hypothetical protein